MLLHKLSDIEKKFYNINTRVWTKAAHGGEIQVINFLHFLTWKLKN